ncbi:hypothetical protein D3C84_1137100 [compost metagenome]
MDGPLTRERIFVGDSGIANVVEVSIVGVAASLYFNIFPEVKAAYRYVLPPSVRKVYPAALPPTSPRLVCVLSDRS